MATRIRLQRHGRKGKPFFHIVVADSRSKRDGRFIEKLGIYNPNTNPATIDLDFDRSVYWVSVGASPSDTARAILSYKGVLMKEHLIRGVTKGALTEEQMEAKFSKWMEDKAGIIEKKVDQLSKQKEDAEKARLAAEKEKSDARAAAIAEANKPEEEVVEATEEAAPAEETGAEAAATDQAEAAVEDTKSEEVVEPAPVEEAKATTEETPTEEKPEEAPAEEAPAEEAAQAEEASEEKKEE